MKNAFVILLLFFSTHSFSQLEDFSNQYWNNFTQINPSMAGVQHRIQGGLSFQNINPQSNNGPLNFGGFFNAKLKEVHGLGVDLTYGTISDFQNKFSLSLPYSYRIPLKKGSFNLGAAPTYNFNRINFEAYYLDSAGNFAPLTIDDKYHNISLHSGMSFVTDRLTAAVSLRNAPLVTVISDSIRPYNFSGEFYGNLMYNFDFRGFGSYDPNSKIKGTLGALYGMNVDADAILQLDLRLMFWQKLTVFGGYRTEKAGFLGVGWDAKKKYRAMYSFQWNKSSLNNGITRPTHEVRLVYQLSKNK